MSLGLQYYNWFNEKVNQISFYCFRYGISNIDWKVSKEKIINPKYAEEFFIKVHKGFGLAQKEIIDSILLVNSKILQCNKYLKKARQENNKEELRKYKIEKINLEYHEKVFRKFADSIAWQLLHSQLHIVRRLYKSYKITPINSSNLKHGRAFVNWYNKKNPKSFALLSDITSFIQIGDVLILDSNLKGIGILELKEGKTNEEILDFIETLKDTKECQKKLIFDFLREKGEKKFKQFMRSLKQDIRNLSTISIINKSYGKDFDTGVNVIISEGKFELDHFNDQVLKLLKITDREFSSTDIIDNCLLVGIYPSELFGLNSLKMWRTLKNINYPIINFRDSFSVPCATPPFLVGIGEKNVLDLLFLRKHLFLCLDFNEWFKLANGIGIEAKWLSRKQTTQLLQKRIIEQKPFTFKERAIEFSNGKEKMKLEEGILARIFFDLVSPLSALEFIKRLLEWMPELKVKNFK